MSSGIFRPLGDSYKRNPVVVGQAAQPPAYLFSAQVLDVCLDEAHELYNEPADIGVIRFIPYQPANVTRGKFEENLNYVAWPLNRNFVRYPLPGEIVVIYMSAGDDLADPLGVKQGVLTKAYYDQNITIHNNPTYNINPEVKKDQFGIRETALVSQQEAEQRFDKKITSIESYKQDGKVQLFKQLKPYEGDTILQGRFGNTIRFGSTLSTANQPWKGGSAGDPVMIMRVDRRVATDMNDLLVVEDINVDDTTVMLCSSQTVDLELACSNLKTLQFVPGTDPTGYSGAPSTVPKSKSEAAAEAGGGALASNDSTSPKAVDSEAVEAEVAENKMKNAAETEQIETASAEDARGAGDEVGTPAPDSGGTEAGGNGEASRANP